MKRADAFKVYNWVIQNKEIAKNKPARILVEMATDQLGIKPSELTTGVMRDIRRESGINPEGFKGAGTGKNKNKLAELERRIEKLEAWINIREYLKMEKYCQKKGGMGNGLEI